MPPHKFTGTVRTVAQAMAPINRKSPAIRRSFGEGPKRLRRLAFSTGGRLRLSIVFGVADNYGGISE
jgi:hypothetical protein